MKNQKRQKDVEMAASLKRSAYHKGEAVRKRKEAQFHARMNALRNGGTYR